MEVKNVGLFDNVSKNTVEKKTLFGVKKEDKNDGGNRGTEDSEGAVRSGTIGESKPSDSVGGRETENSGRNSRRGLFQLDAADNTNAGSVDDGSGTDTDNGAAYNKPLGGTRQNEEKSLSPSKRNNRPTWLNNTDEKEQENEVVDIVKAPRMRRKSGEYMTEEQIKVIFTSLFSGLAMFYGPHWELEPSELKVIPSLARIVNRILDNLPKRIAAHSFMIFDYMIVIGAVMAIVMKRVNYQKEVTRNGGTITNNNRSIPNENRSEIGSAANDNNVPKSNNEQQGQSKGNNGESGNGFTLAPIADLAQHIRGIR